MGEFDTLTTFPKTYHEQVAWITQLINDLKNLETTIAGLSTPEHNSLSGLQGGDATNRWHLTNSEHTGLLSWSSEDPADYSPLNHEHDASDITSGVLDISLLPSSFPGFRNLIIDPEFCFWPEGTSFVPSSSGTYITANMEGFASGITNPTMTQQSFSPGQTDVPGNPEYFVRIDSDGNDAGATDYYIARVYLENVESTSGKTFTYSIYLRAENSGQTIAVNSRQNFGSGGSATVTVAGQEIDITTSWARYDIQITFPSVSGKTIGAGSHAWFDLFVRSGTSNASLNSLPGEIDVSGYVDIALVQVEEGSIVTAFEHRPIALEQRLVERYVQKLGSTSGNAYFGFGIAISSTSANVLIEYKTQMRTVPTFSAVGSFALRTGTTPIGISSLSGAVVEDQSAVLVATVASGLTTHNPVHMRVTNSSDYLLFDARF